MDCGWSQTSSTLASCSTCSKKANSTLWLSALMMHCIFLEGYQTGILPRRALGVRLGGDVRISISKSWVFFENFNRRKYVRSAMPSSGLVTVSSPLNQCLLKSPFLQRNTIFRIGQSFYLFSGTYGKTFWQKTAKLSGKGQPIFWHKA